MGDSATVVTSTRRLSRHIRQDHDRRQVAEGKTAWRPLDVLPWEAWVDRCWKRLREHERGRPWSRALSDEQERLIWEDALRGQAESLDRLLLPREIAREAQRAWSLVAEYRISRENLSRAAGTETRQFLNIVRRVEERLRDQGWCTRGERQAIVAGSGRLVSLGADRLVLAGFDELTPAQSALVGAFDAAGVRVEQAPGPRREAMARIRQCHDPLSELQQAAMAARSWLEARPEATVGVVVADLEQRRDDLEEIFDDILTPGRVMPGALHHGRAWDVSLGLGLSEWPVVDAALRMLALSLGDAVFSDLGLILRSPFVGGAAAELPRRGLLDAWLRERAIYRTDTAGLVRILARPSDPRRPSCPDLLERLHRLEEFCQRLPDQAPADRWAVSFGEILNILGWPGERALDSAEFQCVNKWRQTLSVLASTSQVSGHMGGRACLDMLTRLVAETTFQPESTEAPVQILGLLETPGLSFDALWASGMHHLAWPRPVRPNALIPASLQRACRMPRSCPEVELEFCNRRLAGLLGSSDEVIFSWPVQIDDEPMRPSPMLAGIRAADKPEEHWSSIARRAVGSATTERLADFRLRPWPAGQRARGGSAVVRWQSACPFQAQARSRLDARSLEQPGPGVSPADSGRIAHLALQWLWQEWMDSAVPAGLEHDELCAMIEGVADRACRQVLTREGDFGRALVTLERRRASARIETLLAQDLARDPFTVAAIESCTTPEFEGVGFALRMDRVDRLPGGSLLLIDYKTGSVSVRDWQGERPRDPQLPFYALIAADGDVVGIAYGCLRVGEEGYSGYAAADVSSTGILGVEGLKRPPDGAASWEELRMVWRRGLAALVRDFAAGDARVDPRRISEDCRYCDLASLCRRHELALTGGPEDG